MKIATTIILALFALTSLIAQAGQYDVRFFQAPSFQCDNSVVYFDIQIKASDAGTTFRLSEQNYRFSYDTLALANPRIDQELDISGVINDGIGVSVYDIHSLRGSLGHIISYNIELLSGAGYLLTDTWMSVGRIAFDIIDSQACIDLTWFTQVDYPVTYVSQIDNGVRSDVDEGNYNNYSVCLPAVCESCPSALSLSAVIPDAIYQADVSITSDGTVPIGGVVNYKAGDVILLDNGFTVETQADFSAEISDCN